MHVEFLTLRSMCRELNVNTSHCSNQTMELYGSKTNGLFANFYGELRHIDHESNDCDSDKSDMSTDEIDEPHSTANDSHNPSSNAILPDYSLLALQYTSNASYLFMEKVKWKEGKWTDGFSIPHGKHKNPKLELITNMSETKGFTFNRSSHSGFDIVSQKSLDDPCDQTNPMECFGDLQEGIPCVAVTDSFIVQNIIDLCFKDKSYPLRTGSYRPSNTSSGKCCRNDTANRIIEVVFA